ncbi:hypothetical protein OsI_27674 [Oryza sativa Indica Group]|uniref:Uncharacterized protein n=2 Tax=Oryza TaxID=4527 RepID=A0A0E0I6S9_ORYNI|nr:hypothetical protein OsI_27674 [Oryza sativa Indica Group]
MASGSSAGWPLSPSPSSTRGRRRVSVKPWRLWWRRCAGVAAVIQSKIHRRAVRWPGGHGGGRRRREAATASTREREGWCHHRSFAPVYVDELYSHPKTHHVAVHEAQAQQPNTTAAKTNAGAASGKARAVAAVAANNNNNAVAATNASAMFAAKNAAADAATNAAAGARGKGRVGGGKKAAAAGAATNGGGAKAARGGVRSLLMSPLRGGGACGMGEVDVRAEVFIRKFREEMRLQNQKSAEEFQAMLARGL